MKRIYTIGIAFLALLGVSCSDWMDIRPSTEIEANLLFENEDGFKSALTGVYARMVGGNLYGRELTFDLMEELAQRYNAGTRYSSLTYDARAMMYEYEEEQEVGSIGITKNRISNIWDAMYKDIVNINSLLENLDDHGREVIETDGLFEIMKGEALALRAFHYFDLLRMWGPADLEENGSRPTVPYRTKVGQEQIAPMSADSLVIKIEADLREANSLLVNDPCVWNNDTWQPEYLRFRQHRLNKWAVRGLMARFFLYTNRPDSAAHYALDVVEHCGRSLVTNMSNDHALFDESLFTLHYANMTDDLQNYFSSELHGDSQTQKLITPGNLEYIFETTGEGANDIRGRSGQGFLIQNNVCMSRKFLTIENAEYDYKVPLIRLAEMYYILAETLTGMDAVNYYNDIRNSRGVSSIYNLHAPFATEAEKVKRLTKEYAKEFFGEGQYFFFLKRHQASEIEVGYDDHVFPMEERFYEFEIPDAEKEYGLVPEN